MRNLGWSGEIVALIPNGDLYVELIAKVREQLLSRDNWIRYKRGQCRKRDKLKAKILANGSGIPTCKFSEIENKTFEDLSKTLGTPFLIKPRSLILAQGIAVISSKEEVLNLGLKKILFKVSIQKN